MILGVGLFILIAGIVMTTYCSIRKEKSRKGTKVIGTSLKSNYETIKNVVGQPSAYYKTTYSVEINGHTRYIADEEITAVPVPEGTQKEFIIDEFTGKHYSEATMEKQMKQSLGFVVMGILVSISYFVLEAL